jgi:hypothetical protein
VRIHTLKSSLRSLERERKQEKRAHPTVHPHDIAECEDMLEVYFMQLDFLFGRLATLEEAVEDTEDLIEVDLDHRCRGLRFGLEIGLRVRVEVRERNSGSKSWVNAVLGFLDPDVDEPLTLHDDYFFEGDLTTYGQTATLQVTCKTLTTHRCYPLLHAQHVVVTRSPRQHVCVSDHRRNEMVLLNLVVNGVTLMFAVVSAVTGAFGMNLNAWMPQGTKSSAVRILSSSACDVVSSHAATG